MGTMYLSILIPVYNWNVVGLISSLVAEMSTLEDDIELLVADDCSSNLSIKTENEKMLSRTGDSRVRYFSLPANLGRAAIRNFLVEQAAGDIFLFLDSDVLPASREFLRTYLSAFRKEKCDVICGGISYDLRLLNGREYDYRVYFGKRKEAVPAAVRNKMPERFILSANVLVTKHAFVQTPFDESFTGYGYEDLDWGIRLAEKWKIIHIENTVSHLGLETRPEYFAKLKASVPNYLAIRERHSGVFESSLVGRLSQFLLFLPYLMLCALGRAGERLACSSFVPNPIVFILMQVCFSVFLAVEFKAGERRS